MPAFPLEGMKVRAQVYLVRHGETDSNRNKIIQGQLDTALNEIGMRQATCVAEALKTVQFDVAYSSDLQRATKTAEAILNHHPRLVLRRQAELRERFFGDLQGKSLAQKAMIDAYPEDAMESAPAFSARAVAWWERWIVQEAAAAASSGYKDEPVGILVVSHGGFIGTLVKSLIRRGRVSCATGVVIWRCQNVSITVIEVLEDGRGIVERYGDIAHVEGGTVEENADEAK